MEQTKKESGLQALKFLLFSISAGIIQVAVFTLLDLIGFDYWISYLTALTCSVVWNFTLNREFTFKSANNIPIAMFKVFIFYIVFSPVSAWVGDYLNSRVGWNEYLILAMTMLFNFVCEFLYSKYIVFRGSINTNKRAKNVNIDKNKDK